MSLWRQMRGTISSPKAAICRSLCARRRWAALVGRVGSSRGPRVGSRQRLPYGRAYVPRVRARRPTPFARIVAQVDSHCGNERQARGSQGVARWRLRLGRKYVRNSGPQRSFRGPQVVSRQRLPLGRADMPSRGMPGPPRDARVGSSQRRSLGRRNVFNRSHDGVHLEMLKWARMPTGVRGIPLQAYACWPRGNSGASASLQTRRRA
mmetsp:Transcript_17856/g.55993  ORF Transcript_17856/g.55993 Transcript_17856/m.55993 type:complete len:207 (-) Transcript_17856:254-874(-)